jgi:two-component system sensor histidine kinase MprB
MTLRNRVTLAAGVAVLLAVVAVSVAVYLVERGNLHGRIDSSLIEVAQPLSRHNSVQGHGNPTNTGSAPEHLPLVRDAFMQVVDSGGRTITVFDGKALPITAEVLAVARGERREVFLDTEVGGTHVRVYVTSEGDGKALEVGRSLTEVDQALRQLILTLVIISAAAVGLALVIGRLVAATAAAPVRRVAKAADAVAKTGTLSHHIAVPGGDDLGSLATSFNTMLDALSASLAQQRQLVADASHELRTPLATVRTNVEVLARAEELPPDERAMLIRDTVAQIGELTRLVEDLVELARGDGQEEPFTQVDLQDVAREVVDVAHRNYPGIRFEVDGSPSPIRGAHARVARAVSNLVDNAAKWSPPGGTVEILVRDGRVSVRDRGPGVPPADLPRVFDRFYRSPEARSMPGSGLGLAIVKQVADSHGGTVTAAAAPGGGAMFVLRLPTASDGAPVGESEVRRRLSLSS